jgi:PAT family beta-lactamase induction signal transducer AmpG
MLAAQAIIAVGIVGMATTDPRTDIALMAGFAVVTAFGSATQDIVIDAFRIEFAPPELQGPTAGMYQLGYRMALLCAGAGALYIAEYASWRAAYFAMAALVSVGVLTVFLIHEPAAKRDPAAERLEAALAAPLANKGPLGRIGAWFATAVAGPFVDFFARHGWMALVILLFIGAFRLPDITMGVMANPFYLDVGYSKTDIADVSKIYGVIMGIVGALLGGAFVTVAGLHRPLLICAILAALTNLLFYWLAVRGVDLLTLGNCRDAMCLPGDPAGVRGVAVWHLILTISAENVVGGAAGTVLIAYLSSLTNTAYTATQYALFSSFMSLVGKIVGGASGVIVDGWGYPNFFLYTTAMGIPAVLLLMILARWQNRRHGSATSPLPAPSTTG